MLPIEPSLPVASSPSYCRQCGNLDFYAARDGWWCHWCHPMKLRKVEYDRSGKKPPKPVGEAIAERPTTPFWSPAETLAAWPVSFEPPTPCGPAFAAIKLRARNEKK